MKHPSFAAALLLAVTSAPPLLAQAKDVATIGQWSVIPLASFNPTRSTTTFGIATDPSGAHAPATGAGFTRRSVCPPAARSMRSASSRTTTRRRPS
jgi:hypothetical protein